MGAYICNAKVSWWISAPYPHFAERCLAELPRMNTSHFSRVRLDLQGELAPPKKKGKTGRAYEDVQEVA